MTTEREHLEKKSEEPTPIEKTAREVMNGDKKAADLAQVIEKEVTLNGDTGSD